MKTPFIPLSAAAICFALTACGHPTTSIAEQNGNPLTAARYGDELADTMADLIIQNDPQIKDPSTRRLVDEAIVRGKKISEVAHDTALRGYGGQFNVVEEELSGFALYLDDIVYLSSDFQTKPGLDLHAYMTTLVDPRNSGFPDTSAIDLGPIQNTYGAQEFRMPHQKNPEYYRTFVIFDNAIRRIYGFAQLGKD